MKLLIELDEEYVKAIDKIKFLVGGRTDRSLQLEIIKAIKNGKALEQEPRWIPVSEKLPEENITVIGANKYGDIYKTELYDDCGEKKWYSDGSFDVPIVAWMPLPEPYESQESEE